MAEGEDKTEKIYTLLLEMDQRAIRMEERMATKEDLQNMKLEVLHEVKEIVDGKVDRAKEELLEVINLMSKAVDRDAETTVKHGTQLGNHEVRLGVLEKKSTATSLS
ncbi:hypothetical protein C4568_01350 [Candidatus Parcubacteria bacterium]|nr:MAG: hypothetical protein C4568_01350 [Candidatus Parcubacteria bacterium]